MVDKFVAAMVGGIILIAGAFLCFAVVSPWPSTTVGTVSQTSVWAGWTTIHFISESDGIACYGLNHPPKIGEQITVYVPAWSISCVVGPRQNV